MKKIYFAIIFWAYILFLTIYSIVPTSDMTEVVGIGGFKLRLDYWLHLGAYFGVAFLLIIWRINDLVEKRLSFVFLTFLACISYAYITEIIQFFIPSRAYNIYDFVANASGVILAYLLFILFKEKLKQSKIRLMIS